MKKETREAAIKKAVGKLKVSRSVKSVLLGIWREVDGAHADEIRDLRARLAFVTSEFDPEAIDVMVMRALDLKNKNWRDP